MAKKSNPTEELEQQIRELIDNFPGTKGLSEHEHCTIASNALHCVTFGIDLRLGELNDEKEDGDE